MLNLSDDLFCVIDPFCIEDMQDTYPVKSYKLPNFMYNNNCTKTVHTNNAKTNKHNYQVFLTKYLLKESNMENYHT